MLTIGIRSSSAANNHGIFDLEQLKLVKNTGFDIVELNFNHPQTGLDYADEKQGERFREEAKRLSVRLLAHAPEICITGLDKKKVMEGVEQYKNVLVGIGRYGITSLVMHACAYSPVVAGQEQKQISNFIEALQVLLPTCEKLKISILIETMIPGRITSSMNNLVRVVDAIDSPWIKICVDTNHLNLSEDLSTAICKAGSRIGEFHLSDNHGRQEEHLLPYSGMIDWSAFANVVRAIDYEGDFILEPGLVLHEAYEVACKLSQEFMNVSRSKPVS